MSRKVNRKFDRELERDIVRWLDDELPQPERAPLFRKLLRDPAAHDVASAYQANDAATRDALCALLDDADDAFEFDAETFEQMADEPASPVAGRVMWPISGVAAAIVLLVSGAWAAGFLSLDWGATRDGATIAADANKNAGGSEIADVRRVREAAAASRAGVAGATDQPIDDLLDAAQTIKRSVEHEYIGVVDDATNDIYWIEVEEERASAELPSLDF